MLRICIELGGPVLVLRSQTVISTDIENVASVIAIPDQTAQDSKLDGRPALLQWARAIAGFPRRLDPVRGALKTVVLARR